MLDLMDYAEGIGGLVAEMRSIAFLMQDSGDPEKTDIGWTIQSLATRLEEKALSREEASCDGCRKTAATD